MGKREIDVRLISLALTRSLQKGRGISRRREEGGSFVSREGGRGDGPDPLLLRFEQFQESSSS